MPEWDTNQVTIEEEKSRSKEKSNLSSYAYHNGGASFSSYNISPSNHQQGLPGEVLDNSPIIHKRFSDMIREDKS